MKITWKKVLPWAIAFVAYKAYKLYELSQNFQWFVAAVRLQRFNLNSFGISVDYEVVNPVNQSIKVEKIWGEIYYNNQKVGVFNTGEFWVKKGKQIITANFNIPNNVVVKSITSMIANGKFPVFNVTMYTKIPLYTFKETFEIKTEDYADSWLKSINLWK